MKMNDPKTTIETSFRRFVEKSFGESIEEVRKKNPEEILGLIKKHGKGKSPLFPSEKGSHGLNSETDCLEAVLVHRPGPGVELVDQENPWKWLMSRKPDLTKALLEYDHMIELIRREAGAYTSFLHTPSTEKPLIFPPNQWFTRDHGFMTPYGAVIGNPDSPRIYEEFFVMRRLLELDIPVIFKVYGSGRMEGGDALYLDEKTLLLGLSYRTNSIGYEQIKAVLEKWVVDSVVQVPLRSNIMHLDTVFNIASTTVAAVYPEAVPEDFLDFIKKKGFDVVLVSEEEYKTLATNWLCLGPERILFVDGEEEMNIVTRRELEKRGIDVVSLKMPELLGGAGGPRCMTMPLSRRKVAKREKTA